MPTHALKLGMLKRVFKLLIPETVHEQTISWESTAHQWTIS